MASARTVAALATLALMLPLVSGCAIARQPLASASSTADQHAASKSTSASGHATSHANSDSSSGTAQQTAFTLRWTDRQVPADAQAAAQQALAFVSHGAFSIVPSVMSSPIAVNATLRVMVGVPHPVIRLSIPSTGPIDTLSSRDYGTIASDLLMLSGGATPNFNGISCLADANGNSICAASIYMPVAPDATAFATVDELDATHAGGNASPLWRVLMPNLRQAMLDPTSPAEANLALQVAEQTASQFKADMDASGDDLARFFGVSAATLTPSASQPSGHGAADVTAPPQHPNTSAAPRPQTQSPSQSQPTTATVTEAFLVTDASGHPLSGIYIDTHTVDWYVSQFPATNAQGETIVKESVPSAQAQTPLTVTATDGTATLQGHGLTGFTSPRLSVVFNGGTTHIVLQPAPTESSGSFSVAVTCEGVLPTGGANSGPLGYGATPCPPMTISISNAYTHLTETAQSGSTSPIPLSALMGPAPFTLSITAGSLSATCNDPTLTSNLDPSDLASLPGPLYVTASLYHSSGTYDATGKLVNLGPVVRIGC